jgi:cobalamin biosynthesis protein CobT
MYRSSELAAAKVREEQKQALLGRAFDRVIASQLAKVKAPGPSKTVQSEEDFKAGLAAEREKAEKKGGKKMSARALELSRQGLSGAVVQMMLKEEGLGDGASDSDSDSDSDGSGNSSRDKKKRKKEKKSKKEKKRKKEKKAKKDKKDKKDKKHKKSKKESKKRKRDESSDSMSDSDSDTSEDAAGAARGFSRVRTRSMDSRENKEAAAC